MNTYTLRFLLIPILSIHFNLSSIEQNNDTYSLIKEISQNETCLQIIIDNLNHAKIIAKDLTEIIKNGNFQEKQNAENILKRIVELQYIYKTLTLLHQDITDIKEKNIIHTFELECPECIHILKEIHQQKQEIKQAEALKKEKTYNLGQFLNSFLKK